MIDARAVIKSVFLHTCIENWWGIKNQISKCCQWYLLWAYYAMKIKTFSSNKKQITGWWLMSCLLWRVIATEINSLMNRQRKTVVRKHWPQQFLKHEQSYGIFFCAQLHISANIQWSFVVKTGLNYSQNMLYYKLYIYFFL